MCGAPVLTRRGTEIVARLKTGIWAVPHVMCGMKFTTFATLKERRVYEFDEVSSRDLETKTKDIDCKKDEFVDCFDIVNKRYTKIHFTTILWSELTEVVDPDDWMFTAYAEANIKKRWMKVNGFKKFSPGAVKTLTHVELADPALCFPPKDVADDDSDDNVENDDDVDDLTYAVDELRVDGAAAAADSSQLRDLHAAVPIAAPDPRVAQVKRLEEGCVKARKEVLFKRRESYRKKKADVEGLSLCMNGMLVVIRSLQQGIQYPTPTYSDDLTAHHLVSSPMSEHLTAPLCAL